MIRLKTKKHITKAIFILCMCSMIQITHGQNTKKPNVIFILADDLGYGDVSCYNEQSKIQTPNIDQLASTGVKFTDAHTSSSVCTPTRYGILTGRYNWRSELKKGVLNGFSKALIPESRATVATLMKENGYQTAGIGKWHLGWEWNNVDAGKDQVDYSKKIKNGPSTVGFDYFYGFNGSLDMGPYVWVENDQPTMVPTKITSNPGKQSIWRKGLTSDDFVHEEVLPHLTEKAVGYIEQHANNEKPFFLYLPLPAPHTPILPTEEFRGKSGLDNPYGDFVMMVDWVVSEITKSLKEQGIDENTLLIFTSDNGCSPKANFEQLATKGHSPNGNWRGGKADIYEGGHRIPYIVNWPAKIKSSSSNQLLCTTDLYATLADLLKIKTPDNRAEDSYSFLPALGIKSKAPVREDIVNHSINGSFAIHKGDYKVIFCPGSGGWSAPKPNSKGIQLLPKVQVYNLKKDARETHNIQSDNSEIVEEYRQLLSKYVREGRSTPGKIQQNDGPEFWNQLKWMNE
ncbi:arylsulfatase [Labilibaculum sp.]|uniref:sulfatase family protein n=1 Tax=Labilibaculum sp. TaxID=2060723 RepID=UPI003561762E